MTFPPCGCKTDCFEKRNPGLPSQRECRIFPHRGKNSGVNEECAVMSLQFTPVTVPVVQLDPELPFPRYAREDDACVDLHLHARAKTFIAPGHRVIVGTGVAVAIPPGYAGILCPRSGLAAREGLGILNAPGVIDSGYRGEIRVVLVNHDPVLTVEIERGDRIAQMMILPIPRVSWVPVQSLPTSGRGEQGFGSTGRR